MSDALVLLRVCSCQLREDVLVDKVADDDILQPALPYAARDKLPALSQLQHVERNPLGRGLGKLHRRAFAFRTVCSKVSFLSAMKARALVLFHGRLRAILRDVVS